MASVVFLRAVNVGGHQKFQPSVLAKQLAAFGVVSVGAAGTFVVHEKVSGAKLRTEMLCRLPFEPEMMICAAGDVLALMEDEAFQGMSARGNVMRFVSVMQKPLRKAPALPMEQPEGSKWVVRIVAVRGQFVLTLRRKLGGANLYSNAVVEKQFGMPATTRNWNTITTICKLLKSAALRA